MVTDARNNVTLLHQACNRRMYAFVEFLLAGVGGGGGERKACRAKADVNARTSSGERPLCVALSNGDIAMLKLLTRRPDLDTAYVIDGETVLSRAVRSRNERFAVALVRAGVDVNAKSVVVSPVGRGELRETPLEQAIRYDYRRLFERIVATGAADQGTPLQLSVALDRTGFALTLLACTRFSYTPSQLWGVMLMAIGRGNAAVCADLVLRRGFDVNREHPIERRTCLRIAITLHNESLCLQFLRLGARCDSQAVYDLAFDNGLHRVCACVEAVLPLAVNRSTLSERLPLCLYNFPELVRDYRQRSG